MQFIAAVVRADGLPSQCMDGTTAAFIDEDRDAAVVRALQAAREWSAGRTQYVVHVGSLNAVAKPKPEFTLEAIPERTVSGPYIGEDL